MASLAGLPIPKMDWNNADLVNTFKKFKSTCLHYFNGPLKNISEEEKCSYLLIWTGDEGIELESTWGLSVHEKKKLDTYWTRFEAYVKPKSNFRLARFKLRTLKQLENEPIDSFARRLRLQISECNYANPDEQIIDALIFGSNSQQIQSKLLEKDNTLTLDNALAIARTAEATSQQVQEILRPETNINALQRSSTSNSKQYQHSHNTRSGTQRACYCCGQPHNFSKRENCPAFGTKCKACGKENHWAVVCRSKPQHDQKPLPQERQSSKQAVRSLECNTDTNESESTQNNQLYFSTIQIRSLSSSHSKQAFIMVELNGTPTSCLIDTGAEGNVIPTKQYKRISHHHDLSPSNTTIKTYGGHNIPHLGICDIQAKYKEFQNTLQFHVVDIEGPVIIGLPTCKEMNLIQFNYNVNIQDESLLRRRILSSYGELFTGIGCFKDEYHIKLDPSVTPVVHAPRRVPEALREPLKNELDSLCKQHIITSVQEPTDWVNSIVCVTKSNGTLRVCLDPKDLNKAIRRPHYYTPTLDDILPKLNGAKYFSIIDARSGYWNILLDKESSFYTTFNTPFGRFRFLRMPFGISLAQDVFQRKIDETFGDLPGVTGIADDLVVCGYKEDGTDHDENMMRVLQRAKESGIKFNLDKCKFKQHQIPFYGHTLTSTGLEPSSSKIQAISSMDPSRNISDLQTFLGATQYLSRFIPNLSDKAAPLWDLTKQKHEFCWGPEQQKATQNIKEAINSFTKLSYFDNTKPITIQVDASQRGLGAVLLQEQGPIAFASKLLTETESRYSNIEREMLGVVHGLQKFHHFVYGRPVRVLTDHKPLEAIATKNLANAPPRIARMLIKIQQYNVKITYKPASEVIVADAISRISRGTTDAIEGLDITIHELNLQLNASPTRLSQIITETNLDTEFCSLKQIIMNGWPDSRAECPTHSEFLHYWNYRDELSVHNGIILKGTRIVIPKKLRPEVLNQIHYAHQGIEKCKLRAKGSVFWPTINQDIEQMVKECATCQRHQNANQREPLTPHDVPQRPWSVLGVDLFQIEENHYLLVADYYSKFPVVRRLNNLTAQHTIATLKNIFEEHGIPDKLISDNGTNFTAATFQDFSQAWGFEHQTSSPTYPQSNGFIERNVQTVKNVLEKCKETGADPHLAMLCLRVTPIDHTLDSPCELLNARKYQSNLPSFGRPLDGLAAKGEDNVRLQARQDKMKADYDKRARPLPKMQQGDQARVLNHKSHLWEPAVVTDVISHPKSYIVNTPDGGSYRRNRHHLRPMADGTSLSATAATNGQDITKQDATFTPAAPETAAPETDQLEIPLRRSSRVSRPPDRLEL